MMLKGTQANFVDPASGEKIFPKGYPNQLSDFVNAITRANLKIINMEEHFGTDKLAKEFPRAQKYINWPMLVSFKLVKE